MSFNFPDVIGGDDTRPTTLLRYYEENLGGSDGDEAFARVFLHGVNLRRVQHMMTAQLRERTRNPGVPLIEFSDAIVAALMSFAFRYRAVRDVSVSVLEYANRVFADQIADQNEARYFDTAFWKRWCSQGLPDPNNIPLPLAADYTDYTAEIDSYTLTNPNGGKIPLW